MGRIIFTEIDVKYRIPLQGEYNPGIFYCPCCRPPNLTSLGTELKIPDHVIGFAELKGEAVAVFECPNCFAKSYYHASPWLWKMFCEEAEKPEFTIEKE